MCRINPYCGCGYGEPNYGPPIVIGLLLLMIGIILAACWFGLVNKEKEQKQMELCMLKENNSKICKLEAELN